MKGIERIKILSSDIKDEQLKSIIDYLLSRTDMNDKYLNEEKSLSQMIKFIMREANEKLKKVSISGGSVAYATDEMVFGWADGYNLTPFVIAFKDWCDYMKNKIDKDDNYD